MVVTIRSALLPRLPDTAAFIPASSSGLVDRDGLRFICWLALPARLEAKMPTGDFIEQAKIDTGPAMVEASIGKGPVALTSSIVTGGVTIEGRVFTGPVLVRSTL